MQFSRGTVLLAAAALGFAQWRLLTLVADVQYTLGMSYAVLGGHAEWYVWQGRVLAPFVVKLLGNNLEGLRDLTVGALILSAFLAWCLSGARGMLAAELLFALLLCRAFCPWDIFELPIFLGFALLVAKNARLFWFIALYVLAIFNRQSAQFIALYMVVNPLVGYALDRSRGIRVISILSGLACFGAGLAVTETICRLMGRKPDAVTSQTGNLYHYRLIDNLNEMNPHLGGMLRTLNHNATPLLLWIIVGAIMVGIAMALRRNPTRYAGLSVVYLVMLVAALSFGIARETRNWIDFIPLMVLNM